MNKKTVLIIGSGGREHALGWKIKQSPQVGHVYFAPGNAGTSGSGTNVAISALDTEMLLNFALEKNIDLTIVTPDDALAAGTVDLFREKGLVAFGPTKKAAQIESSKAFAKEIMQEQGIPTARFAKFTTAEDARAYLSKQPFPIVIKASGLALGKGVIIAQTSEEANVAIDDIMVRKVFGTAGDEVIIEEFLKAYEISTHAFCDGETVIMFPSAKDHKTILEDNKGPNTGGMGTIAPVPGIDETFLEEVKQTVIQPLLNGLKKRGISYSGCIYPGLMMTKSGLKVLEFNARFGDPETQSYMRLLDSDLYVILHACTTASLAKTKVLWSNKHACCVVLASAGYPESSHKDDVIYGLDKIVEDIIPFHAGTKSEGTHFTTNGGRVLGVTAVGETKNEALAKAYHAIGEHGIHFAGMQYRQDIGRSVIPSEV